jgi:hypothetical protein
MWVEILKPYRLIYGSDFGVFGSSLIFTGFLLTALGFGLVAAFVLLAID